MKLTLLNLALTCFLFLSFTQVNSQETIDSSGGTITVTDEGSVSYSVGQIVYNPNTGSNGSVGQGVQVPIELITLSIEEDLLLIASAVAYPNPTTNSVQLNLNLDEWNDLSYQLFDINGKMITTKKISKKNTTIPLSELPTAVYFLKIMRYNTHLKTFQILKSN